MALFLATAPAGRLTRKRRLAFLAVFLFLSAAVLITFSRSGWLALGVATLLVPVLRWPRRAPFYLLLLALLAAAGLQSGLLQAGYAFVKDLSASSADFRWHMDRIALRAFLEHPWIGVGVEGLLRWFNPFHLEVHNTYLQVLAEMGLFGAAAFLALVGLLAARLVRAARVVRDPVRREWLTALLLGSALLVVQNLVVMFLWIKFLWFWLALLETAVLVCLRPVRDDDPDRVAFLSAAARDGI